MSRMAQMIIKSCCHRNMATMVVEKIMAAEVPLETFLSQGNICGKPTLAKNTLDRLCF